MQIEKMALRVLGVSVLLLSVATLHAETIKEKEIHGRNNADIEENLKTTNGVCGTSITETVDWDSFKNSQTENDNYSYAGYCEMPLTTLWNLCHSEAAKESVKKSITKITCKFGGVGKRAVSLDGTTLHWTVDWTSRNDTDFIKDYLENKI